MPSNEDDDVRNNCIDSSFNEKRALMGFGRFILIVIYVIVSPSDISNSGEACH